MPNDAAFVVYVAWQVMRVVKWRVLGSHVKGDFQSPAGLLVCAAWQAGMWHQPAAGVLAALARLVTNYTNNFSFS